MSSLTPKLRNVSYLDIIWSHLTQFDIRQIPKCQLCHQRADIFSSTFNTTLIGHSHIQLR